MVTLGVLTLVLLILAAVAWIWCHASAAFIAERVRIELEQRAAERQVQHIAYAAMQRLMDEARRTQGGLG